MASEELQEPIEEKKDHEAIDLQAIHNPITTEYKKEQMEIKREILDGNVDVDKDGDLVKEETELPNQIIAEKPENFKNCTVNSQGDLEEEEVLKHEEASSSLEEPITQEEQEKVNGATGSELHSTQFTEVVLKGDEIPASTTPLVSEEVQEKIDVGEVVKEDAHQNQILNKDETEKDESQSSSKEVHEVPIGNTSQNPEEDVTKEVEIPSSITSPIKEEVSEEAKEKENFIEEVQNEQVHQIEIAKENLAEEDCPEETEDQSRDIVSEVVVISEETIPEEAIQGSKTQEMISEEIKQNEETKATAKMEGTSQIDSGENNPDKDLISYDLPTTNEETGKSNEESASVTPFISEEAKENIDIKEDTKEEAPQNQISKEDEAEKDASQNTSLLDLSERDYQNETEKAIENTSENPEEDVTKEVGLKEVGSSSSVTHPVSEEVLEEAKEKNEFPEEALKEQINQNEAAEENWAAEKECSAEEVQNRDVSEVISEVKPIEESIAMSEKDETTQNDNRENATYKDSTSSHQPLANEETSKIDEGSEQISEEPTLETSTTRDVTPDIEIKDDKDIEKFEDEDEGKSSEEKQSKTSDAILKIEDETLNDREEEKPDENDKLKHKETEKQEVKFCFETEEQLGESKASSSGEEVSAERDTVETETIKKTEEDEKNITQNEITLDSKETLNSEEVAHCDEKTREAKDGFDGDELGEGNREDEVDQGNIEEISEPTEPSNNAQASIVAEVPREEIELQSVEAVSAQLIKSEEALQETPNEGTTLSEMERVNTEYMVLNSERDKMEVENSHEDKPNGDQLVMEEATGQDGLKIASDDNEIETEKLEVGDTSSHGEEKASVTLQNDDELDFNVKPEEKTESETLTNEITQRVETIEEPCITQIKEEPPEVESTIKHNETPNEPSISAIQQDEQIQESDAKSTEANQATDNVSLEEGLEANTTLISSAKQGDARSIAKEEGATTQEENIIVETPKDEAEGAEELKESTEKQVEKIPQIANLTEVTEVELGQSETVGSEAEHLEIVSEDKKFAEESKLTDTDAKSAEMKITKDELMEQKEISREGQIDQTEIISEQDQPSQESDVKPTELDQATDEVSAKENSDVTATLSSSVEQIGERSTGKVEGVILQEENVVLEMPKEEAEEREEKIEETNEKNIEEEIRRTVDPEVCDAAEESQKFGTITKSPQLENVTEELASIEEKSDATATLVPGEGQIIEISNEGSSIVPQSTTESVILPEERVSREVETNEESSDKHIVGEPSEAESTIEHKETSNEPNISTIQQDEQSQESDAKSIEANQVTDDIPLEKGLEDNATLISNAEQGDVRSIAKEEGGTTQEENIIVETPKDEAEGAEELKESTEKQVEEIAQIANPTEVTEVELGQSETVGSEAEHSEVVSEEKFAEESKLTDTDAKSAEMEITKDELMEQKEISRDGQIDQTEIISEQDQPSQESDVKPTEPDQATDEASTEENSDVTATLSSSVEQIGERSTNKEEGVILQEENVVLEMPKEEAGEREEKIEETNEKNIEEEIRRTVNPEICDAAEESQKFGTITKSPQLENVTEELASVEEKSDATATLVPGEGQIIEISNEGSSVVPQSTAESVIVPEEKLSREIETNEESSDKHIVGEPPEVESTIKHNETPNEPSSSTIQQDEQSQESDAKSTEANQATDNVSLEEGLEANATLISSAEQSDARSIAKEEGATTQEENIIVETPKDEAEGAEELKESTEKQVEEIPQIANLSEVTEVELGQSEAVGSEAKHSEVVSKEKFAEESKLIDTDAKSAEMEITKDELMEQKKISRDGQIDQTEIISEQDQPSQESDVKPTEPDQATDEVSAEENSDATAALSSSVEQIGERSTGKEEGVILQEENVVLEMPKEEAEEREEKIEEINEKHREEEIPQIVHPSEISQEQLVESETVGPEAENLEVISNEKLVDESKLPENDVKSAQMENKSDELIEEESNANLSSSVEQIRGEICTTVDPEICDAAEESQKFGTVTESLELENVTEELASVEEKSDATSTLVPGEGQIMEISNEGSSDVPQSTTESVIVPEEEVSRGIETNEKPSDKHVLGEISKIADPEIESTELEKAIEESDSVMEKTDATANLVPGEGHIEEIKIANEESGVGSQSTIESVTVPEERVYQGIETNEAPSDKHIVDELPEKDIPIDSLEAPEEITASPVEEPDYKNVGAEMESASLEKTNREIDVKAILEETSVEKSELIDEKIPSDVTLEVTNPASTEIEELQIREKASDQIIKENKETNVEIKAMKEEKIGMPSCDTVVTMPENQTKEEEISERGKISGEKEIPNVAFEKPVSGEINRDTDQKGVEENREFAADQEAEGQSENKESEGLEHGDFASIVSSFLINKVLSEETQKTDDDTKQNDDALFIPKAIDGETIQQEIRTNEREEIETTHEEISYATSSRREEEKMEIQEPKEEEGVEQDYLPVSRFLMDKIMRQEENKNLEKEEMVLMESRIQEEEEIKVESSNVAVAPEQKGETTSSLTEVTRDFEKGENLIEEVDKSLDGDGGTSREEKIEENSSLATAPKQGGETSLSPIEVDRSFEEDKLTEDQKPKEEKEKTTVSDVGISTVEKNAGENSNFVAVPEQEGETSLSPIEAVRDFEQEEKNSEVKNETVVSDEGMSMVEKIREENTGAVARPTDEIENTEGENSKVAVHEQKGETTSSIIEEVKDSANSEQSKDLVNVPEISSTEKLIEERTVVIPKEEEHKEDVKNLEENYVLVEHEIDQFEEEPNEILEEGKVAKGTSNADIFNQEEKQTTLSAEIQDAKRNSTGVEVTDGEIEQRNLPDAVKILMAEIETEEEHLHEPLEKQGDQEDTKILKEEVTDTMVERIENKNQEKLTEQGATKEEKKSEEVKEEEHEEEEEEFEEERHEEREAEIISTDVPVKAAVRETDTKPMQKKSHNILSGVGSKVKHSLAKVKKAITGKSKNVK